MPQRVLIVEDNPDIQSYCKMVLEEEGFTVDVAGSLHEARVLFELNRPDFAVLDIGLPDGDGLDLIREWRKAPAAPTAVLFLTARGDLKTRLDCFEAGAQDYLQKPFSAQELLARVHVHLRIKKSYEALHQRNYELELLDRARQDMADMIVHDLKTPLTSIKGTLELVLAQGLISQADYAKLIEQAGSATDFMLLMLNDLLDVGRAQQAGLKTEIATLEIPRLFDKLAALFSGRSRTLDIRLALRITPGAERIDSDQNLLYRILANLIANAMKASPRGSAVEVDCALQNGEVRLTVCDRGRGVPDSDKQRIFERYISGHRADAALETGTGLGLAFCRLAVKALQGRIWVEDRDGGGSRFVVELPAKRA